jgi:aspartyl-tRNA(Asn)/glutamyl-tRNA(Gln) amidotransferase subunit A
MIASLPNIAEASRQIRTGQLAPRELVAHCLSNIERQEGHLRAWVLVDSQGALAEAERLGELLSRGQWLGPLHGIPVGIKDIIDVASWPTRAGSPLRAQHHASQDAAVVRRLRQAGAILLGKTVTTEFASFDPPPTRNPCDATRTPGGSSSGSAAAVRAEMCLAALGSQTGGSIIRPAAYCGVCGLKPTYGMIDMEGVLPLSPRLDHLGHLARTVGDLAAVWEVLSSPGVMGRGVDEPPPILRPLRDYFWHRSEHGVRDCIERLVQRFGGPSLELPFGFEDIHRHHRRIMAFEAAQQHGDLFRTHPDQFAPHIRALIEEGLRTDRVAFEQSCVHQTGSRVALENWLPENQFALTPATLTVAPRDLTTTGDPAFNSPWSYLGVPTITLPVGEVEQMPCGVQLIGRPRADWQLLAAAQWLESRLARETALPP